MAGEVAPYLDGIPLVPDAATRDVRFPLPTRSQDQRVYNKATGAVERWSGSAWIADLSGYPTIAGEVSVTDFRYPVGHVKRYGAVGDATTDDTTAIRNAAASLSALGGGVLYAPKAKYKVTNSISLASGQITVMGDGDGTEFASTSTSPTWISSGYNEVVFRDFKVSGTHAGGVYLTGGQRCRILRCTIFGATLTNSKGICAGIYAEQHDDLWIDGCRLFLNGSATGEGHGDIVGDSGTYQLTNSRITNNKCYSTLVNSNIVVFDPRNVLVQGNECTGAIVSPISNLRQGYGILLYHTGTGPTSAQVGECKVIGNIVYSVGGSGIYVQDMRDTLVSNNLVHDVAASQLDTSLPVAGIALDGAGPYVCTGNRVYNSGKDGICVSVNTAGTVVTGNDITGITQNGIALRGVCTDVLIGDNLVGTVTRAGIATWSDLACVRIKVTGNAVRTLNGTAVGVWVTSATSAWEVTDNMVTGVGSGTAYSVSSGAGLHVFDRNTSEGKFVREGFSSNIGDSDYTPITLDKVNLIYSTALTANRTITLPTAVLRNQRYRVIRSGLGAFTLNVGGLKTIPSATAAWVDVEWNDVGAWTLTGYGTL